MGNNWSNDFEGNFDVLVKYKLIYMFMFILYTYKNAMNKSNKMSVKVWNLLP